MTLVNYVTRIKLNSIVSLKTLIFADRYSSGRACPFTRIISFKLCARLQSTRRPSSQPTMTRHPRNTRTSKGHGRDSSFVERRRPESDVRSASSCRLGFTIVRATELGRKVDIYHPRRSSSGHSRSRWFGTFKHTLVRRSSHCYWIDRKSIRRVSRANGLYSVVEVQAILYLSFASRPGIGRPCLYVMIKTRGRRGSSAGWRSGARNTLRYCVVITVRRLIGGKRIFVFTPRRSG